MRCADWPWAVEVSFPHKFSSKVSVCASGSQGLLCFDSTVSDNAVHLSSFSQALYMWRSLDSFCNEKASLSGKQRIVLILFTALFLLDNDGRHSGNGCVMFQFTQEMHYSDTWIRVSWCGGGRPVGGTPVLSPSLVPSRLLLSFRSHFVFLLFSDSITTLSLSLLPSNALSHHCSLSLPFCSSFFPLRSLQYFTGGHPFLLHSIFLLYPPSVWCFLFWGFNRYWTLLPPSRPH